MAQFTPKGYNLDLITAVFIIISSCLGKTIYYQGFSLEFSEISGI